MWCGYDMCGCVLRCLSVQCVRWTWYRYGEGCFVCGVYKCGVWEVGMVCVWCV